MDQIRDWRERGSPKEADGSKAFGGRVGVSGGSDERSPMVNK
jgi:hypothetical protein